MCLTVDQYNDIKECLNHLIKNYDCYEGDSITDFCFYDECEDNIELEENISLRLPGDEDDTDISIKYFLLLIPDIMSLDVTDTSVICTNNKKYYIVEARDEYDKYVLNNFYSFSTVHDSKISVSLVEDTILLGLAAVKLGEYDADYWPAMSSYSAILLDYIEPANKMPPKEEIELVKSFIYEIAVVTNIPLQFSRIEAPDAQGPSEEDYEDGDIQSIEQYNYGIELFLSATQIKDQELKFLNYYKILEHYAPIALKTESFELMRKKLDLVNLNINNGDYIDSIFDLANSIQSRYNDQDLIKAAVDKCFDSIGLSIKLPETICKTIKKEIKVSKIDHSLKEEQRNTLNNILSKILYSTRNNVVHAKANYNPSKNECKKEDLSDLNKFMKYACVQTIKWYNRQPQQLKLSIVD